MIVGIESIWDPTYFDPAELVDARSLESASVFVIVSYNHHETFICTKDRMLTESKDTFDVWLKLFEQLLLVGLIMAFTFLLVMAIKFQDTSFLRKSPLRFFMELLAFSALPAIPLWIFMVTRGVPFKTTLIWFAALWAKFAVLHLLFEFSGVYGHYFQHK